MVSMLLVSRGTITHNPEAKLKPLPDTYLVQYLNQLPLSHREIPVNLTSQLLTSPPLAEAESRNEGIHAQNTKFPKDSMI